MKLIEVQYTNILVIFRVDAGHLPKLKIKAYNYFKNSQN